MRVTTEPAIWKVMSFEATLYQKEAGKGVKAASRNIISATRYSVAQLVAIGRLESIREVKVSVMACYD